jgi:hypothetical protein
VNKLLALFSGKTHTQNLMTKQLSPAAQSVLDAATVPTGDFCLENVNEIAAAALRAAAMQTLLTSEHYEGSTPNDYELGWNAAVAYIQNIADELEGQ